MFVHRTWYWAAWAKDISQKPLHRKFLNQDVALYRDSGNQVHALNAMCPHRGANLAKGVVIDDCLRCPFHALKFDSSGQCVEIPAQPPGERIPGNAKVDVYPIREQDGIIWIWMDPLAEPDHVPPRCDMFDPANGDYFHQTWDRHQKGDFVITVETAIEDSHAPYLHATSLKVPVSRVPKYDVEKFPNERGFTAGYSKDGPWWIDTDLPPVHKLINYKKRAEDTRRVDFYMGAHVRQHFGGGSLGGIFVTPSTDNTSYFAITFAWRHKTPKEKFANFLNRIGLVVPWTQVFEEDEYACSELILTDRPSGLERPVFIQADQACSEFRKIYRKFLLEEGREWGRVDVNEKVSAG